MPGRLDEASPALRDSSLVWRQSPGRAFARARQDRPVVTYERRRASVQFQL